MLRSFLLGAALLSPAIAQADTVNGTFRTEAGETGGYLVVKMGPCSNDAALTCGVIEKAMSPEGKAVKGYEHTGKALVWGMKDKGKGKFAGGKIWAPDTDKTYSSKMEVKGANLKVSGCVAIICRSQLWKPAK